MNNNYCDINDTINKKNLVITEILETEESYVNHLKEIVEVSLLLGLGFFKYMLLFSYMR